MPVPIQCPNCQKTGEVPEGFVGTSVQCPTCGTAFVVAAPGPFQPVPVRQYPGADKKIAAGICGILLGCFGVHKFILGFTTAGVIMLLGTLATCFVGGIVMSTIGLVEGIIYLTKSDAEFYQTYIVEKREWF